MQKEAIIVEHPKNESNTLKTRIIILIILVFLAIVSVLGWITYDSLSESGNETSNETDKNITDVNVLPADDVPIPQTNQTPNNNSNNAGNNQNNNPTNNPTDNPHNGDECNNTCDSLGYNCGLQTICGKQVDCGECEPVCGNNIKESGEICDGTALDEKTCETWSYYSEEIYNSGELSCLSDCSDYNLNNCSWNSPYDSWENGPSNDPDYFPIGVWAQRVSYAGKYKDIGINIIYSVASDLTEDNLAVLENFGVPGIWIQNDIGINSDRKTAIGGWRGSHEPDNAQWNSTSQSYDPCIDPSIVQNNYNNIKSKENTRPVFLILGKGVSLETWGGRGTCTGNLSMYPEYIKGGDIVSFDIYPYATCEDPSIWGYGKDMPELVARGVERLVNWSNGSKVVWNFIETGNINNCSDVETRIDAHGLRAEVWMSLIHGSQGITYFVHEWWPSFKEDGIFRHPEIVEQVNKTNNQIKELASILNSKTIENGAEVSSDKEIKFMVKYYNNSIYLFSVNMANESTSAEFMVYEVENRTSEVIGENREIIINNGKFQDNFGGYDVHLYQIPRDNIYSESERSLAPTLSPFTRMINFFKRIFRS